MNLILRHCAEPDLAQCVELFVSTFAQPPWHETWNPNTVRDRLDQIVKTPHFFGVVAGDVRIRGFVLGFSEPWHEGTHFYRKEMCVDPFCQRQGLGTGLVQFLSEELPTRDTKRIYLLAGRGDRAEAFYTKIGFFTSPKMILMARRTESKNPEPHEVRPA